MSSIFLLIGGTAITLGVIFSYIIAIRAVQESRRSPNYITRQQNTVRARRAYSSLGVFIAAGFLLLIFNLLPGKSLPSIPPLNTPAPLASPEFTQSPAPVNTPENNPTAFILTATPEVPPTPTRTPLPSIPLAVEALFKGDVTPQSDVAINDLKFSTHIENGLPVVITTSFSNPIQQMYVFFTYDRLDEGVQWTALWYRDGVLQFYETKTWDGSRNGFGNSVWTQPVDKWQPGFYEVQIFIGSEWKTSGSFTLTGNPPTITPTPTNTPTKLPTSTVRSTNTATKTALPTATLPAANTPRRTPASTSPATSTRAPILTPSSTPTVTPSRTLTSASGNISTKAPSKTPAITTSATPTKVPTNTSIPTITKVATATKSVLPSSTSTSRPSRTPTSTPTRTPSKTRTVAPSKTARPSATATVTITSTPLTIKVNIVFTDKQLLESGAASAEKVTLRDILSSVNPVAAVIDEYFKGPNAVEQNAGLAAYWNGFVGYNRIDLAETGVLHIYLKGRCQSNGTSYNIARPLSATVKQFTYVKYVKIYDEHGNTSIPYGKIDSAPVCLDPSFTPSPTVTRTPTITPTFTPSQTPTITLTPSKTATFPPTLAATVTPSRTPLPTATRIPTRTPRPTATITPTFTPRPTSTKTPTPTPTFTPSLTPTVTSSRTPLPTATRIPTRTPRPTATITPTFTPRPTSTKTPTSIPTLTPSATMTRTASFTPSSTSTATLDPNCYRAAFVSDITMPDGATVNASEKFTKTWRFKNIGTCTWTTSFKFVFIGGDKMEALDFITLPNDVALDETIDISINLTAPATPGAYKGIWSFQDNSGRQFGLGSSSNGQIWVQVKVILAPTASASSTPLAESTQTSQPTSVATFSAPSLENLEYDFVSEICSAQWFSANIQQPCPGTSSDAQNNISLVTLPALEDGTTLNNPAILISPGITNGSIQGVYPEFLVLPGDHFRAIASCETNSTLCSALFRVSYQDASNDVVDLWAVGEFYDQKYTQIDIDISALAGQKVKFILDVTPLNTDPGNHVFWASPGIYRRPLPTPTSTITPTATATNTLTPTATSMPPTATSTPAPKTEPGTLSTFEKIQKFFSDLFKNIFGG